MNFIFFVNISLKLFIKANFAETIKYIFPFDCQIIATGSPHFVALIFSTVYKYQSNLIPVLFPIIKFSFHWNWKFVVWGNFDVIKSKWKDFSHSAKFSIFFMLISFSLLCSKSTLVPKLLLKIFFIWFSFLFRFFWFLKCERNLSNKKIEMVLRELYKEKLIGCD